jgi:proteasome lid subunit RPN8/RPN11
MTVYRMTDLSVRENRGCLIVPEQVVLHTKLALMGFRGPDGRHEGLVYWLGRRADPDTIVLGAIIPHCDHEPQRVMASEASIGTVVRAARSQGVCLVSQVHSHPGDDTRHSDGDDRLVLMPFDGMFSLVIGRYGAGGVTIETGAGLHQFQDGRWVQVPPRCKDALRIVPTMMGVLG